MRNLEIHLENDKWAAPFLLAASFQGLVKYETRRVVNGILYWCFSPKQTAKELVERFATGTEPPISSRSLLNAVAEWWKQVAEIKKGGFYD
jgi:hypothetical protein